MSEWISVEEDIPETEGAVIVFIDGDVDTATWTNDVYKLQGGSGGENGFFCGYQDSYGDRPIMIKPSHWMALPEPPNA